MNDGYLNNQTAPTSQPNDTNVFGITLQDLTNLGTAAGSVIGAVKGNGNGKTPAKTPVAYQTPTNYTPWIIGGSVAAVLLVGAIIISRR